MLTKTVDASKEKILLEELLALLTSGSEVIITESGTPIARLVSVSPSHSPRVAGLHAGAIWSSEDFDEPLPNGFWMGN